MPRLHCIIPFCRNFHHPLSAILINKGSLRRLSPPPPPPSRHSPPLYSNTRPQPPYLSISAASAPYNNFILLFWIMFLFYVRGCEFLSWLLTFCATFMALFSLLFFLRVNILRPSSMLMCCVFIQHHFCVFLIISKTPLSVLFHIPISWGSILNHKFGRTLQNSLYESFNSPNRTQVHTPPW